MGFWKELGVASIEKVFSDQVSKAWEQPKMQRAW